MPRDEWSGDERPYHTVMYLRKPVIAQLRPFTYELLWESVVLVKWELMKNDWVGGSLKVYDELSGGTEELSATGFIHSLRRQ